MEDTKWDTKYRPSTLDQLIGHDSIVTRFKGMAAKNTFQNAMLFVGPPSSGKTTLARCIAGTINGKHPDLQPDYKEINASATRSIDDMRELVRISKFKPMGKKRIIVIDEAQSLIANKAAADVLLKPLEDSGKTDTIWILCSMEPEKFKSGVTGPAIAKRCTQFVVEEHTNTSLLTQAKRIVKGEKLRYMNDVDLLKAVVKRSESDMRVLAALLQSCANHYDGLEDKPDVFDKALLSEVLSSLHDADDKLVITVVAGALLGKFAQVQKGILDVKDHFAFIKKCLWAGQFLLSNAVLGGAKHSKVWWTPVNKELHGSLKSEQIPLGRFAALNEALVNVSQQAADFSVGADALMSARLYRFIKDNVSAKK